MKFSASISAVMFTLALLFHTHAQEATEESLSPEQIKFNQFIESLDWQDSGQGELKEWATIQIPEGFGFLNGADSDKLMQQFGNLPSEYEGMLASNDLNTLILFQFDDSGYVKDDEKDQLDADKMLKDMQAGDAAGNEYRQSEGLDSLHTEGWAVEPNYNEQTNNLEWGIILRSGSGHKNINYNTKLLGRNGVMHVTLICEPDMLQGLLPSYQEHIQGFAYKTGKTYAEYREGDKVAAYGLTALIAGGALYGAAKMGFLAKFLLFFKKGAKAIIIGIVAVFIGIKKFFSNRLGGKSDGRIS